MTKLIIKFHLLYVQTMSNRFLSPLYTRIKRSCGLHIPTRISFILLYVSYTIRMRSSLLPVRVCCWQVGPTVRNVLFFFLLLWPKDESKWKRERAFQAHTLPTEHSSIGMNAFFPRGWLWVRNSLIDTVHNVSISDNF